MKTTTPGSKVMSLLLAVGGAGGLAWTGGGLPRLMADQRTGVGERRSLRLDEGSQLHLNTATAVDIRYSEQVRALSLLGGEILVQTAPDPLSRPFIVHTEQGSIRALGTRFIVRSEADFTRVCVLEHAVEVRTAHSLTATRVNAGQQLSFSEEEAAVVQPASAMPDAGTRDILVVNDWRLADAFQLGSTDTIL